MGRNTLLLVANDRLGEIEEDKDIGKKISSAIQCFDGSNQSVNGGGPPGMGVISTDSSYAYQLVLAGGNCGRRLSVYINPDHTNDDDILRALADKLGYRLVRKAKK